MTQAPIANENCFKAENKQRIIWIAQPPRIESIQTFTKAYPALTAVPVCHPGHAKNWRDSGLGARRCHAASCGAILSSNRPTFARCQNFIFGVFVCSTRNRMTNCKQTQIWYSRGPPPDPADKSRARWKPMMIFDLFRAEHGSYEDTQ